MSLDLPSRAIAVALASIGFAPLKPRWSRNDATGRMSVAWRLDGGQVIAAQQLLASVDNADPAKCLQRLKPEHPYLVCQYFLEAYEAMKVWLETGLAPLVLLSGPSSRLLRLLPDSPRLRPADLSRMIWQGGKTADAGIASPVHAAIAVVCGFVPHPVIDTTAGVPQFAFAAESTTFPGLRLEMLQRATLTDCIGTYAPGEHPTCYALAAASNLADFIAAETVAAKNPTHQFRARQKGSALMSENLISGGAPPKYRDALRHHLATT